MVVTNTPKSLIRAIAIKMTSANTEVHEIPESLQIRTLHNRDSNFSLTNACVAVVVVPALSVSLLQVFPPRFPFNTHNAP